MDGYLTFLAVLWGAAAGGLAWYAAGVAQQITYVTLADGRHQERKLPLLFRLMLPLTPNVVPLFNRPAFQSMKENTDSRLTSAGFEGLLTGVLCWPWFAFCKTAIAVAPHTFLARIAWLMYLLGPLWLFFYADMWLKRALNLRHLGIQRALPFVLDLLTLSVEAGMDFMTALQRHVERRNLTCLYALDDRAIRIGLVLPLGRCHERFVQ